MVARVVARSARSGRATPIMVAAPLTADATFPHNTRSDTENARMARTSWALSPATRSVNLPGRSSTDTGNMLPGSGCHHIPSVDGPDPPWTKQPSAGEISRAVNPRCVTDAATRRPVASRDRTASTRSANKSGSSTNSRTGRHGAVGTASAGWVVTAKNGPQPLTSAVVREHTMIGLRGRGGFRMDGRGGQPGHGVHELVFDVVSDAVRLLDGQRGVDGDGQLGP